MMINSKYIFTDEEQVAKLQLEIKELENKIAELTDERDSLLEIINTKNVSKLIAKLPCNNYFWVGVNLWRTREESNPQHPDP